MKVKTKIKRKIIKQVKTGLGLQKKPTKRKYFTKEIKTAVLKFQRYRCAVHRCGFPRNSWRYLEFDHIRNRDDNTFSNCQALCPFHHRLKTKQDKRKRELEKKLRQEKQKTTKKITYPKRYRKYKS